MTPARSQYWIIIGLATAVAVTFWLYLYTSDRNRAPAGAFSQPDFSIDQPQWTLFDALGRPDKQLRAERLEQWTNEKGARLLEPRVRIHDRQQRLWFARSSRGHLHTEAASITLEHRVILRREPDKRGLVVKTALLHIADKGDTVETASPVELQAGNWHFTARGLRSGLGGQRLELLEQVKAEFRDERSLPGGRDIHE